ncbi:MAG: AraC family transcriptional regulator [Chloroflexota bacterium]|nr:AraC family transcriptional regulator [Chloroflexota bacterium]
MDTAKEGGFRGILRAEEGFKNFSLARYLPSEGLNFFVEHYWTVKWDLRGQRSYTQEVLPHPSIHLAIERGESRIHGAVKGRFVRHLEGVGSVFAVKFRPGGFYPFMRSPVSAFAGSSISLLRAFGRDGKVLEEAILAAQHDAEKIEIAESFLLERLPARDENVALVSQIVERIMMDRELTRVEDVASQCNMSTRSLQRLFHQYVGVGPKWVIQLYRLHEAAEQIAQGRAADWSARALDLGYTDQAHFIKDFKAILGVSPMEYAKSTRLSS